MLNNFYHLTQLLHHINNTFNNTYIDRSNIPYLTGAQAELILLLKAIRKHIGL